MNRGSTLFLRLAVVVLGAVVLGPSLLWLPRLAMSSPSGDFENVGMLWWFIGLAYALTLPFYFALLQAFKLLNYVDQNKAFSELSVAALKNIKYAALMILLMILAGLAILLFLLQGDRAGFASVCFMLAFASSVILTFAALMQRLIEDALALKSENDLTV